MQQNRFFMVDYNGFSLYMYYNNNYTERFKIKYLGMYKN